MPQLQAPASISPSIITLGIDACDLVVDVLDLQTGSLLALDLDQLINGTVLQHALGVPQRAHDKAGVELCRIATSSKNRQAFGGKFLGDFAADIVAGANDRHGPVSLQGSSPA
jgi:hypothetical protein